MKPLTITLRGQLKSGKNRVLITRTGHRYPPKAFQVWREEMLRQIGPVTHPLTGLILLTVKYMPSDFIRRDVAGMLDAICHLLERAGVVLDDAQIQRVSWITLPVTPKRGQCVLILEELL